MGNEVGVAGGRSQPGTATEHQAAAQQALASLRSAAGVTRLDGNSAHAATACMHQYPLPRLVQPRQLQRLFGQVEQVRLCTTAETRPLLLEHCHSWQDSPTATMAALVQSTRQPSAPARP